MRRVFQSIAVTGVLCLLASTAGAQINGGSKSAGSTASMAARSLRAPEPVKHLVVTQVDVENGKVKLQHQRQGWNRWFELTDDTVIRSVSDKDRTLALMDVRTGQNVSVFIARKLFGGKTVYLNVDDT